MVEQSVVEQIRDRHPERSEGAAVCRAALVFAPWCASQLGKTRLQRRVSLVIILLALACSTYSLADTGAALYKARCSACHGASGTGDTMLGKNLKLRPLASANVQEQSDDALFAAISKGKNRMPHFDGKLSKEQIRNVVKYVRSLKK